MSDVILKGKDASTGQNRDVLPNDIITDAEGNPIGGAFQNAGNGVGNVIQPGLGNTITGQYPGFGSFAQGYNNFATGAVGSSSGFGPNFYGKVDSVTMFGVDNETNMSQAFIHGRGNYAKVVQPSAVPTNGYQSHKAVFVQGLNNKLTAGGGSGGYLSDVMFIQGRDITLQPSNDWGGGYAFAQGRDINIYGPYLTWASGRHIGNRLNGVTSTYTGGPWATMMQGYKIYVLNNSSNYNFMQGGHIYLDQPNGQLAQGYNINSDGANYSLMQGYNVKVYSSQCLAQGYNVTIGNGTNNVSSSFAQGFDVSIGTYAGSGSRRINFAQGNRVNVDGRRCFVQGYGLDIADDVQDTFLQGSFSYITDTSLRSCFSQGSHNTITESYGFVQGFYCRNLGLSSFVQGKSAFVLDDYSFAQGHQAGTTAFGGFAQGPSTRSTRRRQISFGAVKGDADDVITDNQPGASQTNKIVLYIKTTDDTPTELVDFDLEVSKAYSIKINLVARNNDGDLDESACFTLENALAYRDAGGSAQLIGPNGTDIGTDGSIALIRISSGVDISADLIEAGNSVSLMVTGEALKNYRWVCDFEFVEVGEA